MTASQLTDRAIIRLTATEESEDVRAFLQGLVTNDVSGDLPVYAALLTAQGKAMFDFFVWAQGDDILLDCEAAVSEDLTKRLSLYRLRRKIEIVRDDRLHVLWSAKPFDGGEADPRLPELGYRGLTREADVAPGNDAYLSHRLALGVPEGKGELGDILWLETNAIELHGVDFAKGCYVGQENTARMNWRQKVNRRLVVVPLDRSNEKRRRVAYPELGRAVDHLRVSDIDATTLPDWQAAAIAE